MCRTPFDQPMYKIRVSVQRMADSHVSTESYTTSNVTNLVTSFGIDPLMDHRFLTDIIFDIAAGESISAIFQELGLRVPSQPFVPVQAQSVPPRT
jgi:hypothetical protein